MEDVEKKAWKEALEYSFDQADKYGWDKNRTYKDYAIENNKKLYPNKIIYKYSIEYLKKNYKDLYKKEVKKDSGVGVKMNLYLSQRGANAVEINEKNMIYWHIQMNQPWGRNQGKIDSILMLEEEKPIIGTGNWDDIQCRYFTGEDKNGLTEGDIILVREGSVIIALCQILSESFVDDYFESKYHQRHFRYVKVLDFYEGDTKFPQPQSTLQRLHNSNTNSWKFIDNYYRKVKKNQMTNKLVDILKYKKQIILQGPPGTGKTREAKKIAEELIGTNLKVSDLKQYFKVGQKINSTSGIASYYDILEVHAHTITIKNEKAVENREITLQIILDTIQQIKNNQVDKTRVNYAYESALANYLLKEVKFHKDNEQFKLIQFHPSYTYEDFVRGIVSKPNEDGEGIVYEAENKLLADFAKKAFDNYIESNKTNVIVREETSVFDAFIDSIKDELAQNKNHKYDITDAVYLFSADESRFKYKGDNWVAHNKGLNMKFSELKKIIDLGATERQDIKRMTDVEELTRQHATYFIKIVEKYHDFKKNFKESIPIQNRNELKKYVLIIDEINRANLSSVLGELIYALEYRGEAVESMYAVEGDNKLTLPPNLYIIGTMNTADRSVGHIDYAIRRRFAFVDVLPKNLTAELDNDFMIDSFEKVTSLFLKNYNRELDYNEDSTLIERSEYLTNDFDPKDVWLGHSYFIKQYEKDENGKNIEDNPIDFELRKKYEIKPILEEYVKDGILKESAKEVINSL